MNAMFYYDPTVYLFEDSYQIMVKTKEECILWVKVGDRCFYDHSGGIMRSDVRVHRCTVPQALLDEAKEYTVCYKKMIERSAYFPKMEEVEEVSYAFRPCMGSGSKFYHVADVHAKTDPAKKAAEYVGKIDCLILNGDVPEDCSTEQGGIDILDFTGAVGKGEIPTLFIRGNHDTRGAFAEHLEEYIPHREGRTYFTARMGDTWVLCLDCGEDKDDSHAAYNGINCFHQFRLEETEWLKEVIAKEEYKAEGIRYRWIICHHPFSRLLEEPFDIEADIYTEWCKLVKEIEPEAMICGHMHRTGHFLPGGLHDTLGQPCPICVGGRPDYKGKDTFEASTYERVDGDLIFKIINHLGDWKNTMIVGKSEESVVVE